MFKFKQQITGQPGKGDKKKCRNIMVPLKYLSNFWKTLEIPLTNCEINLKFFFKYIEFKRKTDIYIF